MLAACAPGDAALEAARAAVVHVEPSKLRRDGYPNINLTPADRDRPVYNRDERRRIEMHMRHKRQIAFRRVAVDASGRKSAAADLNRAPARMSRAQALRKWYRVRREIEAGSMDERPHEVSRRPVDAARRGAREGG